MASKDLLEKKKLDKNIALDEKYQMQEIKEMGKAFDKWCEESEQIFKGRVHADKVLHAKPIDFTHKWDSFTNDPKNSHE